MIYSQFNSQVIWELLDKSFYVRSKAIHINSKYCNDECRLH